MHTITALFSITSIVAGINDLLWRLDFMLDSVRRLNLAKIDRTHVADRFDSDSAEYTLITGDFNRIVHSFKSVRVSIRYDFHFGMTERLNDVYLGNTCREIPIGYIDETMTVQGSVRKLLAIKLQIIRESWDLALDGLRKAPCDGTPNANGYDRTGVHSVYSAACYFHAEDFRRTRLKAYLKGYVAC